MNANDFSNHVTNCASFGERGQDAQLDCKTLHIIWLFISDYQIKTKQFWPLKMEEPFARRDLLKVVTEDICGIPSPQERLA